MTNKEESKLVKVLVFIGLLYTLFGCSQSDAEVSGDTVKMRIDSTVLSVPEKYILPGLPASFIPKEGLDISRGAVLGIPVSDLDITPRRDKGEKEKFVVSIFEDQGKVNPGALNAWNGKKLFKNRYIVFDDQVDLYRVYPNKDISIYWQYFKASPEEGGDFKSNWVSNCRSSAGEDAEDLKNVRCKIKVKYKSTNSNISIRGEYFEVLDSLIEGYIDLISDWDLD